jgi:hypothetical protein
VETNTMMRWAIVNEGVGWSSLENGHAECRQEKSVARNLAPETRSLFTLAPFVPIFLRPENV